MLQNITLINFRNFSFVDVNIQQASTVFLLGENGHGKTNFLEALYCLSYGSSFRKQKDDHLIKHKEKAYSLKGSFINSHGIDYTISLEYTDSKKKIYYNNSLVKSRQEIIDNYPCIIFKHGDFSLLTGSTDIQRQFLDQTLSLCFFSYLELLKVYNRCLRQKNMALKQIHIDRNVLYAYNTVLSDVGTTIIQYRKKFVQFISERIVPLFKKISGEELNVTTEYVSTWKTENKQETLTYINNHMNMEIKAKYCLSGPHRDKIVSFLDSYPLKQTASTGQTRLLSLLLRIAQSEYYVQYKNKLPTYLFDDVLLEIDSKKQLRFLDELPKTNQAFFTFLPNETIPNVISTDSRTFFIKNGTVKEK